MSEIRTTPLPGTVPNPTLTQTPAPPTSLPQTPRVDGYQTPVAAPVDLGSGIAGGTMSVFAVPITSKLSVPTPRAGLVSPMAQAENLTEIILRNESRIESTEDGRQLLEGDNHKAQNDYASLVNLWHLNSDLVCNEAERVRGLFVRDKVELADCLRAAVHAHITYAAYKTIITRFGKNSPEAYREMTALGNMLTDPEVDWKAAQALSYFFPDHISVVTAEVLEVSDQLFKIIENPKTNSGFRHYAGFTYHKIFNLLSETQKKRELERMKKLLVHSDPTLRRQAHEMLKHFYYEKATLSDMADYLLSKIEEGIHENFLWTYSRLIERFEVGSQEVLAGIGFFRSGPDIGKSIYLQLVKKLPDGHEELLNAAEIGRREIALKGDSPLYRVVVPKLSSNLRGREIELLRELWCRIFEGVDRKGAGSPMSHYEKMLLECGDPVVIIREAQALRKIMENDQNNTQSFLVGPIYRDLIALFPEEIFFDEVKKLKAILKKYRPEQNVKESFDNSLRDRLWLFIHRRRYGEGDDRLFERYAESFPVDQNNKDNLASSLEAKLAKARKDKEERFDVHINLETGEVTYGILSGSIKISFVKEQGFYHLSLESAREVKKLLADAANTSAPLPPGAYRNTPQEVQEKKLGSLLGILKAIGEDTGKNQESILDSVPEEVEAEVDVDVALATQESTSRFSMAFAVPFIAWFLTFGRKGKSPFSKPEVRVVVEPESPRVRVDNRPASASAPANDANDANDAHDVVEVERGRGEENDRRRG